MYNHIQNKKAKPFNELKHNIDEQVRVKQKEAIEYQNKGRLFTPELPTPLIKNSKESKVELKDNDNQARDTYFPKITESSEVKHKSKIEQNQKSTIKSTSNSTKSEKQSYGQSNTERNTFIIPMQADEKSEESVTQRQLEHSKGKFNKPALGISKSTYVTTENETKHLINIKNFARKQLEKRRVKKAEENLRKEKIRAEWQRMKQERDMSDLRSQAAESNKMILALQAQLANINKVREEDRNTNSNRNTELQNQLVEYNRMIEANRLRSEKITAQLDAQREEAHKMQIEFEKLSFDLQAQLLNEKKTIVDLNKNIEQQKVTIENQNKTIIQINAKNDVLNAQMRGIIDKEYKYQKNLIQEMISRVNNPHATINGFVFRNDLINQWEKASPYNRYSAYDNKEVILGTSDVKQRLQEALNNLENQYMSNSIDLLRTNFNLNAIIHPELHYLHDNRALFNTWISVGSHNIIKFSGPLGFQYKHLWH